MFFADGVFPPISLILSAGWESPGVSVCVTCLLMTLPSSCDIWDHHHTQTLSLVITAQASHGLPGLTQDSIEMVMASSNLAKLNTILILTPMIFRLLLSGELSRGQDNYTITRSLSNEALSLVRCYNTGLWLADTLSLSWHPSYDLLSSLVSHLVTSETGFTSDKIVPTLSSYSLFIPDTTPPSVSKLCKEMNLLYIQARGRR